MINTLLLASSLLLSVQAPTVDELLKTSERLRETNCDSAYAILDRIDPELIEAQNTKRKGEIELHKGLSTYCLGEYEKALFFLQHAIVLFDSAKADDRSIVTINLIGTLLKKQGHLGKALAYYQQGLEFAQNVNDQIGIGNSLNNIGLVHLQQEDITLAKRYFLESTTHKKNANDTVGLSYNYDNLGQVYGKLNLLDSSIYYFELAAQYKHIVGERIGGAIVQNNIGEMLLMNGMAQQAENYFTKALLVAQEVNFVDFEKHVLLQLSQVYEQTGELTKAFDHYKQHVTLSDSLFNIAKTKAVAELETKYETSKKEQQIRLQAAEIAKKEAHNQRNTVFILGLLVAISLLTALLFLNRNRLMKKQTLLIRESEIKLRETQIEAAISSQEKERSRFAKDLHDGFGQMISILNLNLQSLEHGDKNKREVFESSSQVLEEMYQELKGICFNLMPQTLIKHGISAALNEFASRINQTNQLTVTTDFFGIEDRLNDVQEISLYRISQEWVNNVIKYSDAQKVTIQITKDDDEITLLIEDDGLGFDAELLRSGKGNGWKNMNSRANLIKGELELDSSPGVKGNTLIVNAPILQQGVLV